MLASYGLAIGRRFTKVPRIKETLENQGLCSGVSDETPGRVSTATADQQAFKDFPSRVVPTTIPVD